MGRLKLLPNVIEYNFFNKSVKLKKQFANYAISDISNLLYYLMKDFHIFLISQETKEKQTFYFLKFLLRKHFQAHIREYEVNIINVLRSFTAYKFSSNSVAVKILGISVF